MGGTRDGLHSRAAAAASPDAVSNAARRTLYRRAGGLLLSLASLLVGLGVVEVLLRFTGIEHRLVVKALFFQAADGPVHRLSADSFLHYELKPGARYEGSFPGRPPYTVT